MLTTFASPPPRMDYVASVVRSSTLTTFAFPCMHMERVASSTLNSSTFIPISTCASGAANFISSHLLSTPNESVILFKDLTTKMTFARHNAIVESVLSFEGLIAKRALNHLSYNFPAVLQHQFPISLTSSARRKGHV